MIRTTPKIGPAQHGQPMTLAEFDHAEVQDGYRYELGHGVIVVSDVPNRRHLAQFTILRRQLAAYDLAHPGSIHTLAGGGECKILVPSFESERHPDLAVYLTPPPDEEGLWSRWVPAIVIEIVSPGSEQRDYQEKREEYLAFGVREYWIVDADRREVLVLKRSAGRWRRSVIKPPNIYQTRLLPGFELACQPVFQAAEEAANG